MFKTNQNKGGGESPAIVADLDALEGREGVVVFQGKRHRLIKLNTARFFKICNSYARLGELANRKGEITTPEYLNAYVELFSTCCPSLKREHVNAMSVEQVAATTQGIMDFYMAKSPEEIQEQLKKKLNPAPTQ